VIKFVSFIRRGRLTQPCPLPEPRGISSSWKCQPLDGEHRTGTVRACLGKASSAEAVVGCISGREVAKGTLSQKRSEAELNLDAIKKSAKTYFVERAEYPRGSAGPTPSKPCCEYPTRKCPANPSDWEGVPTWDALDFTVTEDHYFQYSYESDGSTYEARAVGDLDCDGTTVTYVMRGRSDNGNPTTELEAPRRLD